jgi:glycosyltransferase involved in cell wall biosynthesis
MRLKFLSVEGVYYSVDWLIVRSGYVAAWGWLLHRAAPVTSIGLLLETRGTPVRVEGHYGIPRSDVAATCGDPIQAGHAGFVCFGRVPAHTPQRVWLEVMLASGRTCRIALAVATMAGAAGYPHDVLRGLCPPGPLTRIRLRYWWSRVLLGDLAKRGLHRLLRTRGRSLPRFRAGAQPVRRLSIEALLEVLGSTRFRPLSLMIDHNLGGGTTLYREQWIRQQTHAGGAVVLLYYNFHRLRYFLRYVTHERDESFGTDSLEVLLMLATAVKFDDIFLNHVCSFRDPLLVTSLVLQLRCLTGAQLTVAVHDYFSVCPSWNLLNDKGRFCAVPHIVECRRCLPNIRGEVRSLVGCDDIDRWRAVWGKCLEEATTVLCFSRSSQELVARAYPDLSRDKFVVRPHTVDYLRSRVVQVNLQRPLHIGVVGEITEAKGAAIVLEMARLIRTQWLPARITVIGQLHGARESQVLRVLGPYQREHLPDLVEGCGANVFLLPSVWPETFSYVVEELMQLGVPLVVFNMGAPAERVAHYENGLVVDRVDATHVLQQLIAFHAKLRTR